MTAGPLPTLSEREGVESGPASSMASTASVDSFCSFQGSLRNGSTHSDDVVNTGAAAVREAATAAAGPAAAAVITTEPQHLQSRPEEPIVCAPDPQQLPLPSFVSREDSSVQSVEQRDADGQSAADHKIRDQNQVLECLQLGSERDQSLQQPAEAKQPRVPRKDFLSLSSHDQWDWIQSLGGSARTAQPEADGQQ